MTQQHAPSKQSTPARTAPHPIERVAAQAFDLLRAEKKNLPVMSAR